MRIVVTTSQNMAGVVEKKVNTINISPFDTTPKALIDAKGDLLTGISAGVLDNLPVGTDGHVLIADSAQTNGMKWGIPSSSGAMVLHNNDASDHALGTVVIIDPSVDYGVKKTTDAGDPKVYAIAVETVSSGTDGLYSQSGQLEVLVQGNVSRGQWLICSTTSGRAAASTYNKPTNGAIGIAQTAYAGGGAGSVIALVDIDLGSTAPLQQLATKTKNSGASPLTTAHTTDAGTDLLIVRIVGPSSGTTYTSCTYNGTGMTGVAGANGYAQLYYLRNPSIGTYNIVLTASSACALYATNYAGSQSTPLRTSVSNALSALTSSSLSPTSAVGDIVLDVLRMGVADWSVTGGQTEETNNDSSLYASYKAGGAGSTTVSWAGASGNGCHLAFAIAGS